MVENKRLLAVSWMMPPLVFPRAIQVSRALKALHARGWTCDVVTVEPNAMPTAVRDDRFARLYDQEYTCHAIDLRKGVRMAGLFGPKAKWAHPANTVAESHWLNRAPGRAGKLIRSRDIGALVTFAQPWINHVVGLEVSSRNPNVPWIAHFSDPWVDNPYARGLPAARHTQWQAEERAVVERSDALIFTNQQTVDLTMAKYPGVFRDKVFIVPHGYDVDLLNHIDGPPPPRRRLQVVHSGNLYTGRRPDAFLRALVRLRDETRGEPDLEATFVGTTSPDDHCLAAELGLADTVRFLGPKPYLDSLQIVAGGDVLLVIDAPADTNPFLPSKIVDYFMFGKPILGLTPQNGATADVLRRCGHDTVVPDDDAAIAVTLRTIIARWKAGDLGKSIVRQNVERYDIRSTSNELERAINKAIEGRNRR